MSKGQFVGLGLLTFNIIVVVVSLHTPFGGWLAVS